MDPITLLLLLSAALGGYVTKREIDERKRDTSLILGRVYTWDDNWIANELLSPSVFAEVGQLFDLPLTDWWPQVDAGVQRAFVIAEIGAPIERQMVMRAYREGEIWRLDAAYHKGMAKVYRQEHLQRISQVLVAISAASESDGLGRLHTKDVGGYEVWEPTTLAELKLIALKMDVDIDDYIEEHPGLRAFLLREPSGLPAAIFAASSTPTGLTLDSYAGPHGAKPSPQVHSAIASFIGHDASSPPLLPSDDDLDELVFLPAPITMGR